MIYYITKYATTKGIIRYFSDDKAYTITIDGGHLHIYNNTTFALQIFSPNQWTTSKESAIATAELLRRRKIKSLQVGIEKLESMVFE